MTDDEAYMALHVGGWGRRDGVRNRSSGTSSSSCQQWVGGYFDNSMRTQADPHFPLKNYQIFVSHAIIYDTMEKRRLSRLRKRLQALRTRSGNIESRELERLARALGRQLSNRGKEPTFVSTLLPQSRPLSIPHHSGTLKRGTANNILDQLEKDIDDLEEL
jgi:hypothetical protein